jgi:hypothetical protein
MARYNYGQVLCRSKMQKSVVLSSAEAEYYLALEMAIKIIYQPTCSFASWTTLLCSRTPRAEWANHVIGGRERAKHIDTRQHFAHEAVQNGHMSLYKIATEFQLADIFTKALQLHQFDSCLHRLLEDAEDSGTLILRRGARSIGSRDWSHVGP